MSNNREFSQLASYVEVKEGNNSIGIATGGTQSVGIATTSITFEGTTGYINAKGFYKNGVEVAPVSSGTLGVWETTAAGINTTSNVGIGSTIPTAKLDVDGTLKVSGVSTFQDSVRIASGKQLYNIAPSLGGVFVRGILNSNQTGLLYQEHLWTISGVGKSTYISQTSDGVDYEVSMGNDSNFYIGDNNVTPFKSIPSSISFEVDIDGATTLYHNHSKKLETTTDGFKVLNGTSETAVISGPQNIILDPSPDDVVAITTGAISAAGVSTITGITTTNIAVGNLIQEVDGVISTGTTVTSVGISSLTISNVSLGSATNQEFTFANQTPTGIVRIKGDFYIDGTRTEINSTTLTIDDLNVVVASGASNGLTADTAGLTVDGVNAYLKYNYNAGTNETWELNKNVGIGTDNATAKLDVNGDLNVSGIVTANSLDAAISEWTLGASGTDHYTFTGPGLTGAENDPSIYLTRGQKYRFKNPIGAHPFQIQTVAGSAGIANTYSDGVVGNKVTDGTLTWDVQFDAPDVLYYQCTAHANMGGKIYIGNSGESISVGDAVTINSDGIDVNGIATIRGGTHYLNFDGAEAPQIRVEGSSDLLAFRGNGYTFTNGAGTANIAKLEDTFHEFYISGDVNPKAKIISTGISLVGVVTALSGIVTYYGDGSNLTGISAGGGGGDGGDFNTSITSTEHSVASNNIDGYTAIGVTFPTTASKRHYIESIHVTNISNSDLYLTSRIDYNGGQDVPLTHRVLVPYQGALEILDEALIANPSDNLRFAAYTGIGTAAGGVSNGLDCWVSYETKDGTDYVGAGMTLTSTNEETLFTSSNANGTIINTIQLTNYAFNVDVDVSVSLHDGSIRQGYFVKNLTVPQNSSIQILPKVKKVANGDSIKVQAGIANAISVNIAGKNI